MRVLASALVLVSLTTSPVAAQSDAERADEAKRHYRIAVVALRNGDRKIASVELQKAVELDPSNALIHYNLAVVQKADDPAEAAASLKKARELGLPPAEKQASEDLDAEISYALQKRAEAENPELHLSWLVGRWTNTCEVSNADGSMSFAYEQVFAPPEPGAASLNYRSTARTRYVGRNVRETSVVSTGKVTWNVRAVVSRGRESYQELSRIEAMIPLEGGMSLPRPWTERPWEVERVSDFEFRTKAEQPYPSMTVSPACNVWRKQ